MKMTKGLTLRLFSLLLTLILLEGCVSGPKTENKSPLDFISRKKYEATSILFVIPVTIKRKEALTTISGRILLEDRIRPAKWKKVQVEKEGRIITETTSDAVGNFQLQGDLPNGSYNINIVTEGQVSTHAIVVDSYEIKDMVIMMNAR